MDHLVGIPWRDRGRTLSGVDCYGLFRLAFHEHRGIWLPSHTVGEDEMDDILKQERREWQTVEKPEFGDAVLMRRAGHWHIGFYVGRRVMLHIRRDQMSLRETTPLSAEFLRLT